MKYVFIQEIKKYIFNNKTVIFSQFQSFNKSNLSYLDEIKNFLKINDIKLIMPIVRNRTSPNTFFITLTNNKVLKKRLVKVFEKFIQTEKKFNRISHNLNLPEKPFLILVQENILYNHI